MDIDGFSLPKDFDFSNIEVVMDYDLGKDLQSSTKFITLLEEKVLSFYSAVMQYFEKWVPTSPKTEPKTMNVEPAISSDLEDGKGTE